MRVADIMTRPVVTVRNSVSIASAIGLMRQKGIQALVVERSHPEDAYGILTTTDIVGKVIAFGRDPRSIRVHEIMTKPCIVLNPDLGLEYAARLLTAYGLHCAPVIQTELLGIVSVWDILERGEFLQRSLETELSQQIQQLTEAAEAICRDQGPGTPACAAAWAAVDVLQAELAHQRREKLDKTAFETYRETYPDALATDEYDAWCSG
jgi:CBS domain-containing protein